MSHFIIKTCIHKFQQTGVISRKLEGNLDLSVMPFLSYKHDKLYSGVE